MYRYRIQKVYIEEADSMSTKMKQNEELMQKIERTFFNEEILLPYEDAITYQRDIDILRPNFPLERI